MNNQSEYKKNNLYIVLCCIFLANALIAEIIGVKIFSLESTLGLNPAQISIFGFDKLDFNLTAGVVLWPVVFITSDIINEYFGIKGVKKISYITSAIIVYMFFVILLVTKLNPATFWIEINKIDGSYNINDSYNKIFKQGLGIMVGSILAFLVGQIVDSYTFQWLKKITGSKIIWLRATGSTLVSQLIDSFLVLWIAFFVFGDWSFDQVLAVGAINYIYKFLVAIALTPVLYLSHYIIGKYIKKSSLDINH